MAQHILRYHPAAAPSQAEDKARTAFSYTLAQPRNDHTRQGTGSYTSETCPRLKSHQLLQPRQATEQDGGNHLDDEEDILGGVGDGEYGRAGQRGDGRRLDVRTQHCFRLLGVQVKEKVFRYLTDTEKWTQSAQYVIEKATNVNTQFSCNSCPV